MPDRFHLTGPEFRRWLADTTERSLKTFVQSYLAVWIAIGGTSYDTLFTLDNLKAGVVGLALAVAVAVGAKQVGAPDSASLLPADTDPPQNDRGVSDTGLLLAVLLIVVLIILL